MKCLALTTCLVSLAMAGSLHAERFTCPVRGGDIVFGQEANVNSLDQMTSSTISTRNIAMNIFETLMTRDENNPSHTPAANIRWRNATIARSSKKLPQ